MKKFKRLIATQFVYNEESKEKLFKMAEDILLDPLTYWSVGREENFDKYRYKIYARYLKDEYEKYFNIDLNAWILFFDNASQIYLDNKETIDSIMEETIFY